MMNSVHNTGYRYFFIRGKLFCRRCDADPESAYSLNADPDAKREYKVGLKEKTNLIQSLRGKY